MRRVHCAAPSDWLVLVVLVVGGFGGVAVAQQRDAANGAADGRRPRARDLGITIGVLPAGKWNAITDVEGVSVGHRSLIQGGDVRTGVTAVLPHGGNVFQSKVPAALFVANGFGKFVGSTQIQELGVLETPIVLTNTLSTFAAADALVAWSLRQKGNETVQSVNPTVGECNDGYLNDIRGQHVRADDVLTALSDAKSGAVTEGSVGAGVGTRCLGWKGGIGSSSRKLPQPLGGYTVGVLVQTNFDGQLTIDGAPVGQELGRYYLKEAVGGQEHGSCIVIVATDAPLDARQLGRLAKRAPLGLGAVGSPLTHGSGDYCLAFSTHAGVRQQFANIQAVETRSVLRDDRLSPLFQAVREATEEAVVNSLLAATTITGRDGHTVEAINPEDVVRVCRKFGVISKP
jgi:D-aminopeptidase